MWASSRVLDRVGRRRIGEELNTIRFTMWILELQWSTGSIAEGAGVADAAAQRFRGTKSTPIGV